jgi:hypothetical protein
MTRLQLLLALCLLAFSSVVLAHDPLPLPQVLPPRLPPPPSNFIQSPANPAILTPLTIDELQQLGLSPTVYHDLAAQIKKLHQALVVIPRGVPELPGSPLRSHRFVATTETSGSNHTFLNNDTNEDTESSVVSVPLQTTGVNTPFVAWMSYANPPPSNGFHVNVSHWSSSPGTWITTPEILSDRSRVGDPILAEHPYVAGFNPQTVYCVTTNYDLNPSNPFVTGDSAITVWQNSGSGWTSQDVDFRSWDKFWFLDKPSITVSTNPATHGTVYVAYRESPLGVNGNPAAILVAMENETTGGQFLQRARVPMPTSYPGSQYVNDATLAVDPSTGYVWVSYIDWYTTRSRSSSTHGRPVA